MKKLILALSLLATQCFADTTIINIDHVNEMTVNEIPEESQLQMEEVKVGYFDKYVVVYKKGIYAPIVSTTSPSDRHLFYKENNKTLMRDDGIKFVYQTDYVVKEDANVTPVDFNTMPKVEVTKFVSEGNSIFWNIADYNGPGKYEVSHQIELYDNKMPEHFYLVNGEELYDENGRKYKGVGHLKFKLIVIVAFVISLLAALRNNHNVGADFCVSIVLLFAVFVVVMVMIAIFPPLVFVEGVGISAILLIILSES